ncbi:MAG TPA: ATP-binding cassette domain-containing protein, partial [Solirubrobacteraceae bacterium]|nr:ATP-binding cassette domain-containing protein [Solirubrobacteraceae bacterium]
MTEAAAIIETRGLRRVFNSRKGEVEAVAGVDLTVRQGEIFGFLGPNGAGKTTTLRMLSTLLPPSGGTARVAGCDLASQPDRIRERIGYVGQAGGGDRDITGRRELVFQGRLYGMSSADAAKRAAQLIAMLELEVCADRAGSTYSGGQKRRLDIGLGLVHDPQLLFLDEPTTGLDPQARRSLWDVIEEMRASGKTVFLTTHSMEEAERLCDRVAIMDRGR